MSEIAHAVKAGTHMAPDTRTLVAAALDGGTALHVAAASGRNSHVSSLLAFLAAESSAAYAVYDM